MNIDWDTVKYLGILPATWLGKLIWSNHKSLQELREAIAADYPTWTEMKTEISGVSEQKDKMFEEQKEDLTYIRSRLDKLVDRQLDKKE
jgi:hypothetical protein